MPVAGELEGDSSDPFNLGPVFPQETDHPRNSQTTSASSSAEREPKPGEPLSAEAEKLLADLAAADDDGPEDGEAPEGAALEPVPESSIEFDAETVREVLEESFGWLADRFDSDHWRLTERQSRMLTRPTTQLLGSVWTHIRRMLLMRLERWSETTPGLMDFALIFGIVVAPKVTKQIAITRERRNPRARRVTEKNAGPQPVPARAPAPAPRRPSGDDEDNEIGVRLNDEEGR